MDYDSRPLYFLNVICENLKPLICVILCFYISNARVSSVHIPITVGGGRGGRVPPPHFSGWGDSIGIIPPLFSSEKLRGI